MEINDYVLLIIKGENKTQSVYSYNYNPNTKKWDIRFNNGKLYSYSYNNVVVLKYSEQIPFENIQVLFNGQKLNNIKRIWSFKDKRSIYEYWKIQYQNGFEVVYNRNRLEVINNCRIVKNSSDIFSYIKELSSLFDFVKNRYGENVLENRIKHISFVGEKSALACYLNPGSKDNIQFKYPEYLVFPFGCNNSQYKAVNRALCNRISIIQGPPGTGKTQTILNLIANIVIQGKTVLVVSNNNSAIENVLEKLSDPKKSLDFIVAYLGKKKNKDLFILKQSGKYPNFNDWNLKSDETDRTRAKRVIQSNLSELKNIFDNEEKLAELKSERDKINTEFQYFTDYINEYISDISSLDFGASVNSKTWLYLWNEYQLSVENKGVFKFIQKIKLIIALGKSAFKLFKLDSSFIINVFQYNYYRSIINELNSQIEKLNNEIKSKSVLMNSLMGDSLELFRYSLVDRYHKCNERPVFEEEDLWKRPNDVLYEYPVILSTAFSSNTSLNKNVMYDYVVIDEASQVDIVTGALALSCAKNAVIVGDMKQLPNVVNDIDKKKADSIYEKYDLAAGYRYTNSFMKSILDIIPDIECTLLREHYRCHPKIINYCNQKFYNNELLIMTEDKGEKDVIVAYKTVKGNHSREKYSERQIDVIKNEIIPKYIKSIEKTGIIAPYRNQVYALQKELEGFEIATVHKFQGREKDTIIISTVDDEISDFVDNPNLLNVAISRAKKQLFIVTSGNEQREDSNISSLLEYIEYNNLEMVNSQIHSVFDYLYKQFNEERNRYLQKHKRVSEYDSENLMFNLIQDVLKDEKYSLYDVMIHYPMNSMIRDTSSFTAREKSYALNPLTHLDFLIFKKMNKQPVLAIEVDGYSFHKDDSEQGERDKLKNHILEMIGLPLLRLRTNESNEKERVVQELERISKTEIAVSSEILLNDEKED